MTQEPNGIVAAARAELPRGGTIYCTMLELLTLRGVYERALRTSYAEALYLNAEARQRIAELLGIPCDDMNGYQWDMKLKSNFDPAVDQRVVYTEKYLEERRRIGRPVLESAGERSAVPGDAPRDPEESGRDAPSGP